MKRINLITPLSRGENLKKVGESILTAFEGKVESIKPTWWIVKDQACTPINQVIWDYFKEFDNIKILGGPSCIAGHAHRNTVLRLIDDEDEWIYSVDDDNIIHPGFVDELINCEKDGLIVAQSNKDHSIRLEAGEDKVRLNCIDTAQYAFKYKLLEGLRFNELRYDADGVLIEEVFSKHKDSFKIVNQPLSYYNYLR